MDATFDTICSVIISSFEDEETPQQIAEWSQARAGKRITESNKPSDWYITKRYGWTILENEAYWRDRMGVKLPEQKFAFILARVDKGAVWPAGEALAAENSAYFSGAHERNARRRMELDRGDNITHAAPCRMTSPTGTPYSPRWDSAISARQADA